MFRQFKDVTYVQVTLHPDYSNGFCVNEVYELAVQNRLDCLKEFPEFGWYRGEKQNCESFVLQSRGWMNAQIKDCSLKAYEHVRLLNKLTYDEFWEYYTQKAHFTTAANTKNKEKWKTLCAEVNLTTVHELSDFLDKRVFTAAMKRL